MTYAEAIAYLQSFADYERQRVSAAPRFNLERVRLLCAYLGAPQEAYPSIHIAGTKGKGSVAAMIDSVLRAAGYRVGLYTSPHLHTFRERIRVNGGLISEETLCVGIAQVRLAAERVHKARPDLGTLTTFELTTALALAHFAAQKVDWAVLEVGMGGRLDATNIVHPRVAIITSLSLDHTHWLGDTLEKIAVEKAGIIKEGVPTVSAPQPPEALAVLEQTCRQRAAPLFLVGREVRWREDGPNLTVEGPWGHYAGLTVPLLGRHQRLNAATAIGALDLLRLQGLGLSEAQVRQGLAAVRWPGRMEVLGQRPWLVVDGAHNAASAQVLVEALAEAFPYRRLLLVLGTSLDKDIAGMVAALAPATHQVYITQSRHPRAAPPETVAACWPKEGPPAAVVPEVAQAVHAAMDTAQEEDLVCVTGSLFVAAEAREGLGVAQES